MRLVRVSAVWCPSCLVTVKDWKKIQAEVSDLMYEEWDYDFDPQVKEYQVGTILPVHLLLDGDKEIGRLVGEKNYKELFQFLKDDSIL